MDAGPSVPPPATGSTPGSAPESGALPGVPARLVPHGRELGVMSFNLRYPALDRNPWPRRLPVARRLLTAAAPHLVGTQEGTVDQLTALVDGLPDRYAWVGEGRDGGDRGEFTAILYDRERIEVESTGTRWLSTRPDVAGSVAWGARHPRTVTWIDATDLRTGTHLRFLNCHLDHRSHEARQHSARILLELAAEAGGSPGGGSAGADGDNNRSPRAVILTGDFNVDQRSDVHALLTTSPWFDDAVAGAPGPDARINTFHGYRGPREEDRRIDWILHSPAYRPRTTGVLTHGRGHQYPSDHFPVQAVLVRVPDPNG